jgi:hypothetical protein
MVVPWVILADASGGAHLYAGDPRLVWGTVALCSALLFAAVAVALFTRWRKRDSQNRPASGDQLAEFRVLYEQGKLSQEEFHRIRSVLGERMRQELELPPPEKPGPPANDSIRSAD